MAARKILVQLDNAHRIPARVRNALAAGEVAEHAFLGQRWTYTPGPVERSPFGPFRRVTSRPAGMV